MGFGDAVVEALALLTHDPSVPYFDYIKSIAENPIAKKVKLADLEHNSDITRLNHEPTRKDSDRNHKYMLAMTILENDLIYRYNEPSFEEIAHEEDSILSVSLDRYDMFLRGFNYGMIAAELFLRTQFEIEDNVLYKELAEYRDHMIEFTWLDLRDEPEWHLIERYRTGVLDAKLLPAKEGDRFYNEIEYTLKNYPGYTKN